MKHTLTLTAAALVTGFGAAQAQEETVGEYDTNGDGYVSSAEFVAHSEGEFDRLDADRSGGVSRQEFAAGQFSRHDVNEDEALEVGEYRASLVGIDALRYMGQEAAGVTDDSTYRAGTVGIDALQNMGQEPPQDGETAADAGFSAYDADSDQALDHDEYVMSLGDAFEVSDRDASGELSPQELEQARFSDFDSDDDGRLDTAEFQDWVDQQDSPSAG